MYDNNEPIEAEFIEIPKHEPPKLSRFKLQRAREKEKKEQKKMNRIMKKVKSNWSEIHSLVQDNRGILTQYYQTGLYIDREDKSTVPPSIMQYTVTLFSDILHFQKQLDGIILRCKPRGTKVEEDEIMDYMVLFEELKSMAGDILTNLNPLAMEIEDYIIHKESEIKND